MNQQAIAALETAATELIKASDDFTPKAFNHLVQANKVGETEVDFKNNEFAVYVQNELDYAGVQYYGDENKPGKPRHIMQSGKPVSLFRQYKPSNKTRC